MKILKWIFGTPAEAKPKAKTKLSRVSVHFQHLPPIVHYARSVKIFSNGSLSLYSQDAEDVEKNSPAAIAHYTLGNWTSYSLGKRCYSKNKG